MADTPRGYPVPASTDVVSLDAVQDLADAIDTDVTAVAAAAGSALASHEADTTSIHGIPNTALLVATSDTGTVATAMIADSAVTSAKIADGTIVNADVNASAAIAATKVAGTAVTQADTGTVTNTMLAGSIAPAKVTGTAVVTGDSRLSDARTPTAHAASHGTGQSDAITIAPAQVTGTAVVNTLVDAKGDLLTATAADTPARLAVGSNGDLLVASSGATTGLAWRSPWPITASATGVTLDRANPVYTFTDGSVTATLPTASTHTGVRFLVRNAGSGTVTVSGISGLTIPGAGYVDVVSDGTTWLVLDGQYSTESVGRRIYSWDAVNARWQQTYGDTGWRDVSAGLKNGYTGALYFRRIGVYTSFTGAITRATANGAYDIPAGFRPLQASAFYPSIASRSATTGAIAMATVDAELYIYGVDNNAYSVNGTFVSGDEWPTALPGTAQGSIPQ